MCVYVRMRVVIGIVDEGHIDGNCCSSYQL